MDILGWFNTWRRKNGDKVQHLGIGYLLVDLLSFAGFNAFAAWVVIMAGQSLWEIKIQPNSKASEGVKDTIATMIGTTLALITNF
jgi:hypothetical protein